MPINNLLNADMTLAAERRKQKFAAAKALPLKRDFLDDPLWVDLARSRGERLPNWTYPPEPKLMRRWLRKLKISEREYLTIMGFDRLEQFYESNPTWPVRAWCGLLLEFAEERDNARNRLRRTPE